MTLRQARPSVARLADDPRTYDYSLHARATS